MDITSVVAIAGLNIALISWLRSDMQSFRSEIKSDMNSFKSDIRDRLNQFESEIRIWNNDLKNETKDFHGRLCALEEKKKNKCNLE